MMIVTDADLLRFQSSNIIYISNGGLSQQVLEKEVHAFIDKNNNDKEFSVESIEFDRAILKWKIKQNKESIEKLKNSFSRVIPGGMKDR